VANKPTSPQDATGRAVEEAAKRNAAELAARKDEIALSRQAEAESLENDVFDPRQPDAPILLDEVEELGISVAADEFVIIRTQSDIEDMTYGVVNGAPQNFTFKAGVKYKVPVDLASYLARLGYTWKA
jgi:hypothetical protein